MKNHWVYYTTGCMLSLLGHCNTANTVELPEYTLPSIAAQDIIPATYIKIKLVKGNKVKRVTYPITVLLGGFLYLAYCQVHLHSFIIALNINSMSIQPLVQQCKGWERYIVII